MLFLLERDDPEGKIYDCNDAFLVRARSEKQARKIASKRQSGDEPPQTWLDPKKSSCEIVPADGEPGIIMTDFHAG